MPAGWRTARVMQRIRAAKVAKAKAVKVAFHAKKAAKATRLARVAGRVATAHKRAAAMTRARVTRF